MNVSVYFLLFQNICSFVLNFAFLLKLVLKLLSSPIMTTTHEVHDLKKSGLILSSDIFTCPGKSFQPRFGSKDFSQCLVPDLLK